MANILVVDDEVGIRELLIEILNDEGHVVDEAENAQQARQLRAQKQPDLVLLDIWMPDTDGLTLLKEWGQTGQLTMPVIMMSGHATIDTAVEATKVGALDFLEKPIALQKLLAAVQDGLEKGAPVIAQPVAEVQAESGDAQPAAAVEPEGAQAAQAPPPATALEASFELPLRDARDAFERAYFSYHLDKEHGSMTRVAERTGLERTHLYRKLKQLGVPAGRQRGDGHDES